MKKFGAEVGQDGVTRFLPTTNVERQDHISNSVAGEQSDSINELMQKANNLPDYIRKEFYSPSHFYEGVPRDFNINLMHIAFTRQRTERVYSFV